MAEGLRYEVTLDDLEIALRRMQMWDVPALTVVMWYQVVFYGLEGVFGQSEALQGTYLFQHGIYSMREGGEAALAAVRLLMDDVVKEAAEGMRMYGAGFSAGRMKCVEEALFLIDAIKSKERIPLRIVEKIRKRAGEAARMSYVSKVALRAICYCALVEMARRGRIEAA